MNNHRILELSTITRPMRGAITLTPFRCYPSLICVSFVHAMKKGSTNGETVIYYTTHTLPKTLLLTKIAQ